MDIELLECAYEHGGIEGVEYLLALYAPEVKDETV